LRTKRERRENQALPQGHWSLLLQPLQQPKKRLFSTQFAALSKAVLDAAEKAGLF
jgi:hypothetical protein